MASKKISKIVKKFERFNILYYDNLNVLCSAYDIHLNSSKKQQDVEYLKHKSSKMSEVTLKRLQGQFMRIS